MSEISEAWSMLEEQYRAQGVPPRQLKEAKRIFYFGAAAGINGALDKGPSATMREIDEFVSQLGRGT